MLSEYLFTVGLWPLFVLFGTDVVDAAYKTFSDPEEPIKTRSISADITLLEMFHGKSKAFKDLSMSCAAQFMQHFLQKRNSRITHLIGLFLASQLH